MPNHPTLITDATVQCGFPLPAQATMHKRLDLNDLLVKHTGTTYCVPVRGESMRDAGINDGDYTVKRLYNQNGIIKLQAANPDFPDIEFNDGQELIIWGIVTWTLKPI